MWLCGGAFLALAPFSALLAAGVERRTRGSGHARAALAGMPALTFGVYAIALATSAEIAAMPRLKGFALMSLAFVPVALLLAASVWQFPVVAVGIVLAEDRRLDQDVDLADGPSEHEQDQPQRPTVGLRGPAQHHEAEEVQQHVEQQHRGTRP